MPSDSHHRSAIVQSTRWYDLFSRGARDWLRHNEKVRESVKESLPELVSGPDVLTQPENRTVKVPVMPPTSQTRFVEPSSSSNAAAITPP